MSLSALPPMRVPTLTEVVDWPPVEWVAVEEPAPVQIDAPADDAVEARIDDAVELTTAEPVAADPLHEAVPVLAEVSASDEPAQQPVPMPVIDETALTQRLLTDLQHQVDSLLEQQLRAAMQPVLSRMADTLAQQAHEELASALRDMVALAVSREMIRLRAAAPSSESAES
ncbi:MAG: hypothetical protein CFE40_03345 [Burkholderiales bacterium PBB1]|nr:MAG: hypothetical protein CFE40_03345 [Burkholderiales bacterium PBB1]